MRSEALTPLDYLDQLPEGRKAAMVHFRNIIVANLPAGFEEGMGYGMLGYFVPHTLYPAGYHCNPTLPLPFLNLASQKNFIALYHMGLYADPELIKWFIEAYPKHTTAKLDMGKSCIRFKNMETIPWALITELLTKMTPDHWISLYEKAFRKG